MRWTHLRGHEEILKRLLIHVGADNVALLRRRLIGAGTPRGLHNLARRVKAKSDAVAECVGALLHPGASPLECFNDPTATTMAFISNRLAT